MGKALRAKLAEIDALKVDQVIRALQARGVHIGDRVDVVRLDRMWNSDKVNEVRQTGIFTHVELSPTISPYVAKIKADGSPSSRKLYLSYGVEIVPVGAPFPKEPNHD